MTVSGGKAVYDIKIAGNTYADKDNRRLTFTVTNTGTAPGEPGCTIMIETPEGFSRYYYGQDYVTWSSPLSPGEQKYFEGLVQISDEGAAYATHSEVSCI